MRTAVSDGDDIYRVVIIRRQGRPNPDYDRLLPLPQRGPYTIYDGEEYSSFYGPYNFLRAARGVLNSETKSPPPGVASGKIQKATVTWEDVQ